MKLKLDNGKTVKLKLVRTYRGLEVVVLNKSGKRDHCGSVVEFNTDGVLYTLSAMGEIDGQDGFGFKRDNHNRIKVKKK